MSLKLIENSDASDAVHTLTHDHGKHFQVNSSKILRVCRDLMIATLRFIPL